MIDDNKIVMDVAAAGTVLGTLAGWLPTIAAAMAIVWYLVRLWETETVQKLVARWRQTDGK